MSKLSDEQHEELEQKLSHLFCQTVTARVVDVQSLGAATITIADVQYLREGSNNLPERIRQSVVMIRDESIHVPQFALWPHFKGVVGKIFSAIGGMMDIDFNDSPEFSRAYQLHGWNEEAVRALFTKAIRDHFSRQRDWSVRGDRDCIAVFRQAKVVEDSQREEFQREALEILELFQIGEEQLDERPEIRRTTNASDALAAAQKIGGIQGHMLQQALNHIALTKSELDQFLDQAVPRRQIPTGLRRQFIGDVKMLIALGGVLLLAGVVIPLIIWNVMVGDDRYLGIYFGAPLVVIGGGIAYFAARYRSKKMRILRDGVLVGGIVTSVKRTSTEINGRRRYHLSLRYDFQGQQQTTRVNIYSGIENAMERERTGDPVRVLVDPADSSHVLCLDTLVLMS